jgi:hypothetical protein
MSDMFDAINQMHPRHRSAEAAQLFKPVEFQLVDNKVVKFQDVRVHEFRMGDVEDPDLYAAQPIYEWQQSEAGQWIMEHAVEKPFWHRHIDPYEYGYRYYIIARLAEQDLTYWALKWQKS